MTPTLGIIGVGAFGKFILRYLIPFFRVHIYDNKLDTSTIAATYNVSPAATLAEIALCDVIIIAVPISELAATTQSLSVLLGEDRPGNGAVPAQNIRRKLVMDVASVKVVPARILTTYLPQHVDIVGLHPLFGPQSGSKGIHGLNIAACNLRGNRMQSVSDFLANNLGLNVIDTTPEGHDKDMATVQGLTHMIGRIVSSMALSPVALTTKSFEHLREAVEMVRHDSDELFRAIETENPFMQDIKDKFRSSVAELEQFLQNKNQ